MNVGDRVQTPEGDGNISEFIVNLFTGLQQAFVKLDGIKHPQLFELEDLVSIK